MDGFGDHLEGDGIFLDIGILFSEKIFWFRGKTEKTESFGQFHHRTGFCLVGGAAFAHLFFCSGYSGGILAASAEIDRNVQAAIVDPNRIFKDIQIDFL